MSVTTNRGEPRLQPNYFSSSIFVKAFRDDITSLIHTYHETYAKDQSPEPFSLFKQLWVSLGWKLVHLKITENRARDAFLEAVCRMFLGVSHNFRVLAAVDIFYRTYGEDGSAFYPCHCLVWLVHIFLHATK